jgi:hypothetical protein
MFGRFSLRKYRNFGNSFKGMRSEGPSSARISFRALFSSCLRLRLDPYSHAGACEHVDELIYTETADLPGQQITDAGLCLVEEIGRLSLGPSTFLDVTAEIKQQVSSYF